MGEQWPGQYNQRVREREEEKWGGVDSRCKRDQMEENYKTGTGEMDAVLLITEAINATVYNLEILFTFIRDFMVV